LGEQLEDPELLRNIKKTLMLVGPAVDEPVQAEDSMRKKR